MAVGIAIAVAAITAITITLAAAVAALVAAVTVMVAVAVADAIAIAIDGVGGYYFVKLIEKPWNVLDADLVMRPISDATKFFKGTSRCA